jgi:predicted Zn-dependent protease
MNLSGYTRATEYDDHIAIHKIALSNELRDPESVELIMCHELGHVLGLNLSGVYGDMMYVLVVPGKTGITQRDHTMINWLYNQENYIPIRTY